MNDNDECFVFESSNGGRLQQVRIISPGIVNPYRRIHATGIDQIRVNRRTVEKIFGRRFQQLAQ